MTFSGRTTLRRCVFRVERTGDVWSVSKDNAFYGEFLSRDQAVKGACLGARTVESSGRLAQVLSAADGSVIPHQEGPAAP